jgi:type I restriction enzyme R subunit
MPHLNENTVEYATIEWLPKPWDYRHGETDIGPEGTMPERRAYDEVILQGRLRDALTRINTHIPAAQRESVWDGVLATIRRAASQNVVQNNHVFHRLLTEGVDVQWQAGGKTIYEKVWLVDFRDPTNNDFLAANQVTITDFHVRTRARTHRRPDVIGYVNGLPLIVIELKNAADENATLKDAFNQLQTYKEDLPTLMQYNALYIISDGLQARLGTVTAGWEWFKQWRTVDGDTLDPYATELETLLKGVLPPRILLDILRYFIVFEQDGAKLIKKVAGYHQYHAVNKAIERTKEATMTGGDQRAGVVWHTQGSGKSLTMLFYAGKIIQDRELMNPTLVILTDRNDLDDQLFSTFAGGKELLRQDPVQALNREHMRDLLQVASGGVVFTTIQKFRPDEGTPAHPLLSDRRNIIFIADEAHRSQYGLEAKVVTREEEPTLTYGFAHYVRQALPHASFIGFTGTPVESTDANTRLVFGDYIDVYDIQRAVDDKATVPIFYEARLARLQLREEKRPTLDPDFEEITEGEEETVKEGLKRRWTALEAMVGTPERLKQVAQDIVEHFENRRQGMAGIDFPGGGKGMIVCMSRRICVELYNDIIALRPDWHDEVDDKGSLKVIMTGSAADDLSWQPHIRSKPRRKALSERFKDATDPFQLVIVRDMWLTGFDAPALHTMYVDKPMRGHGLMQAIARVNRVFHEKTGGLIVDYLGIATFLQKAVQQYTQAGSGEPAEPQEKAVTLFLSEYRLTEEYFVGFDIAPFFTGSPAQRLTVIPNAMEHILQQPDGKKRYVDSVLRLSKAFSLAIPHPDAMNRRDKVAFFQAVRAGFVKATEIDGVSNREGLDHAVQQLVSQAVVSPGVIDILSAAGMKQPDVSVLSDEFLEEIQHLPQKNLALELLRKLLNDEIKTRTKSNVVKARYFSEMLENTIRQYQNRTIDAAQVIAEAIELAREIREERNRGKTLGLSDTEIAFYDALADNESAKAVLGDQQLAVIAMELVQAVRQNTTIDWMVKQSARAKIRVLIKRILRKFGYPPDLQEKATDLVLQQAEQLASELTER